MDRVGRDDECFRKIKYHPLPSQRLFHGSNARFKGFSGPIGSGKSQALCQEAIKLTYLNVGRLGLIGAPTYPMLRDATLVTLFEILEVNKIPFEYSKADNVLTMTDTGSRILCRSVDEFERLRGTNLAWFAVDELTLVAEEAWLVLEGRLRDLKASCLRGFAVWTPKGFDWVYRKFVEAPGAQYEVILAKPFENSFLLDQIPDYYERLRSSYDQNYFEQEVMGRYLNLQGGLVYQAFERAKHMTDLQVNPGAALYWAMDFNVDPMSSVVVQIVKDKVFVLDEIVMRRATTQDACDEFLRRFPSHEPDVVIYGDASGNHRQTTGSSDYQIVRDTLSRSYGERLQYRVPKANPSVRDRITLTNAKLCSGDGEIHMLIDRKCTELIKDFEQVSYHADSTQIDKDKDRLRTHVSDALGYVLWQEFKPSQKIGERGNRLL